MGKTDHDQYQIDKIHYCSVTFSKIMSANRLISTVQTPCTTEENNTLVFKSSELIQIGRKICFTIGYRLTENQPVLEGG